MFQYSVCTGKFKHRAAKYFTQLVFWNKQRYFNINAVFNNENKKR